MRQRPTRGIRCVYFISLGKSQVPFLLSDDAIPTLWMSLTTDRLTKYLEANAGERLDALKHYERNIMLSSAFYAPLQCLEICFRNQLNHRMLETFGVDWFISDRPPLQDDARRKIAEAITKIGERLQTNSAIVAELSLGFWVSLLGPRYDATLWRSGLHRAFQANGRFMKRNEVHGRFNRIRRFRNRVAHHEPIVFMDLAKAHREMMEAIRWMCPVTADWAEGISTVPQLLEQSTD